MEVEELTFGVPDAEDEVAERETLEPIGDEEDGIDPVDPEDDAQVVFDDLIEDEV